MEDLNTKWGRQHVSLQRKGVCGKERVLGEITRKVLMTGKEDQKNKKTW